MPLKIEAIIASITSPSVGTHAIVNASNPEVSLGGGVSRAIREACGPNFQKELRELLDDEFDGHLEAGDCLVSGPGTRGAFRWILHVPAVDYGKKDPQTGGPSGPKRVWDCMLSVLDEAVCLARESGLTGQFVLATPALGAGSGGLGTVASLDAMMGATVDWMLGHPAEREVLSRVIFTVLDPRDAELVALAAARHGLPIG
jgi:O-acetyl-ADP-ribose deacetylase (regulator of RNase III)